MLENDIMNFSGQYNIILCGDINARTSNISDIVMEIEGSEGLNMYHQIECDVNQTMFPTEMCQKRVSEDTGKSNTYGRKLIEMCKSTNIRIVNGRAYSDQKGKLTRIETTGCSVVDYCICDSKGYTCIKNFRIGNSMPESDHCPLLIDILCDDANCVVENNGSVMYKFVCKAEDLQNFNW
jgi:exonuclease III